MNFRQWCTHNGCFAKRGGPITHVLMDGGILYVPSEREDEFARVYFDRCRKEKIYAVEAKTDTFCFFADVDYKDTEAMDMTLLKEIVSVMCSKVDAMTDKQKDCVVKFANPKPCREGIKSGIHMHWPDLVVTKGTAMILRNHLVNHLVVEIPGYPWDKIIDIAVYKGSGLRLPWSWKRASHDKCKGHGCDQCEKGKINEPPYLPICEYSNGEITDYTDVEQQTVELFKRCWIRSKRATNFTMEEDVKVVRPKKEGGFSSDQTRNAVYDPEILYEVQKYVRANLEGQERANIKNIFHNKKRFLVKTDSRYCANMGKNHNSTHVWFACDGHTIAQKCFCRCETTENRRFGFCKDFKGTPLILSGKLKKMFSALHSKEDVIPDTGDNSDSVRNILSII